MVKYSSKYFGFNAIHRREHVYNNSSNSSISYQFTKFHRNCCTTVMLSLVTLQLENSIASRRRESILVGLPTFLCRKFPTKEYRKSLGAVCSRSYDQKFVIIQEYAACLDTWILLERVYLVRGILLEWRTIEEFVICIYSFLRIKYLSFNFSFNTE